MNILADFHHSSLFSSYLYTLEGRLGHKVYRQIGRKWFDKGYWKINRQEDTIQQYLATYGYDPLDGTPPLNQIKWEDKGIYYTVDPNTNQTHKAIEYDTFLDMDFDIIIASIPDHIEPFKKLAKLKNAKFIFQAGNEFPQEYWNDVPNFMGSIMPRNLPMHSIFYHQEFDTKVFKYKKPPKNKRIHNYMNCLKNYPMAYAYWNALKIELPEYEFYEYGAQNKDGTITGINELADSMHKARWIFHVKPGGDGYGHCYDRETEILTENGWKLFADLKNGEKVATIEKQSEGDVIKFEKPIRTVSYNYRGELLHFKGKGIDLMVTDEHRMYVEEYDKNAKSTGWTIKLANELDDMKPYYPRRAKGIKKAPDVLVNGLVTKADIERSNFTKEQLAEFMGWYLAEGSLGGYYQPTNKYYAVSIANANILFWDKIEGLLSSMGFEPHILKKGRCVKIYPGDNEFVEYLRQFGHSKDKYVPNWIKNGSIEVMRGFLDSYFLSEGHRESDTTYRVKSISKQLIDDAQEIAIKLGYRTSVRCKASVTSANNKVYELIASNLRNYVKLYHTPKKVKYDSMVYCVEVKSGLVLVRRNGTPAICGNCAFNTLAVGRPVITNKRDYEGKLFGTMLDSNSSLLIDCLKPKQLAVMLKNREENNEAMGLLSHKRFTDHVDFKKEATVIDKFIKELI